MSPIKAEGKLLLESLPRPIRTEAENENEQPLLIPDAPGYRVLQTLMENRRVKQADLLPIFGSRGVASEVFNGKRAISKALAKKLGEFSGGLHLICSIVLGLLLAFRVCFISIQQADHQS
jgi:hypothetical protein